MLIICVNVYYFHIIWLNPSSNEILVDFEVFYFIAEDRIVSNFYYALVVIVEKVNVGIISVNSWNNLCDQIAL